MTQRNIKQAQMVADILNATKAEPRSIADTVELTGATRYTVRKWLEAFEAVGMLQRGKRRMHGGRAADTWRMP